MRPEMAQDALLANLWRPQAGGGAVLSRLSPMALERLGCALGQHSLVSVLPRCGLPLPVYVLVDEKQSRCRTDTVYLPTVGTGRVIWPLDATTVASVAAFTESYRVLQRAASRRPHTGSQEPSPMASIARPRAGGRSFQGCVSVPASAMRFI